LFAVKTTILIHIEQSEKIDVKQTNKQKGGEGEKDEICVRFIEAV
jgi:hypothetical protein